jgi:hypothetical protein
MIQIEFPLNSKSPLLKQEMMTTKISIDQVAFNHNIRDSSCSFNIIIIVTLHLMTQVWTKHLLNKELTIILIKAPTVERHLTNLKQS